MSKEVLYRGLLDLSEARTTEALLDEALRLAVRAADASIGYVELYEQAGEDRVPRWARGYRCEPTELEAVRAAISQGIIARALLEGRTIQTASAISDERFRELGSVRRNQIGGAICAPIGVRYTVGALYVQHEDTLSDEGAQYVALVARQLGIVIAGIDLLRAPVLKEEVRALQQLRVREALARHGGSVTAAAGELGVGRGFIYKLAGTWKK